MQIELQVRPDAEADGHPVRREGAVRMNRIYRLEDQSRVRKGFLSFRRPARISLVFSQALQMRRRSYFRRRDFL
jgi:hypothetical protein